MTGPILLFDGTCGLCATSVRFILARERRPVLRFAPLTGETARGIVRDHPWLAQVDSLVLVEAGRVRVRSGAALGIVRYLRWPWPLARVAVVIPRTWRDRLYGFVARHRHRLSGDGRPLEPRAMDGRLLP